MKNGLSLYIHWPFCLSKCPYCDFNSHLYDPDGDSSRWVGALLSEMRHFAAGTGDRTLKSIFFGGGTPSTMEPDAVAALIAAARELWPCEEGLEITLEANPTSAEAGKLKGFAAAGVTRISLGVQSFSDKSLKFLGREHFANDAVAAISTARQIFAKVSFDLIYGLPGQTVEDWKNELNQGIDMSHGHLSLYQLSVEKGTGFHRRGVAEVDPDHAADLYQLTHQQTSLANLNSYEISNHARPGHECRHNVAIWRGGDYLGIGPGAHGRIGGPAGTDALHQVRDPARWLALVAGKGHGTAKRHTLKPARRGEEIIITGLRLGEGISAGRFHSRTGLALDQCLNKAALDRLVEGGFLIADETGLRATMPGRMCLNAVLAELLIPERLR